MDIGKITKKSFVGKCALAGILSLVAANGIEGIKVGSGSESYRNESLVEIKEPRKAEILTEEDLRRKIREDLEAVGYEKESLLLEDEELLALHEKEYGIVRGKVYISDIITAEVYEK